MKPAQSLLAPDNHTLVLIDFEGQMAFATNSHSMQELRQNTGLISGGSKVFGVPTIVTTVGEHHFAGPVFPEILEYYPKEEYEYIDRTSMNTWEDEAAYKAIIQPGKKKIVMAGLWTSVCIVYPALSAIEEGYEVYVIADACGDVTMEAHNRAMERMVQAGVQPITSVQYVLELQRDWARPTGGAVSRLMRKFAGTYGIGMQYAEGMLRH